MLDIALSETLETKSADIESDDACGEALCQEVLASYWISGCNGDPFENLKLKYAAAVERSSDCALQLQGQSCSSLFTKSLCSCKNEEKFLPAGGNQSKSHEDKDQIHFQDHLHISFDDSDDDSRFEMAVEDTEFKIRARNDSNADICEKCVLCQRSDGVLGSAQRSDAFRTLSSTVDDDTINVNRKVALLDVSRNLLSSMTTFASTPVSTVMLEGLEVLLANSNRLTEFRCKLAQHLGNLKELKLSHNNLLQFPMSVLTHCPHLILLDITHNGLRDLDLQEDRRQRESWKNGISGRFSGTEADGNQMFAPAFLHKNMLTLKMAHNQLTRFPYHICSMLPKLKSLDVSSNEIEDLSVYMVDVEVSEHINLSHNSIKFIPDAFITKICKTKHLDLSWNSILEVSDFDGMEVTSGLNKLNLSHNQITQFPGALLNMKRLKVLNLSSNQISSFPELCAPTALMKDLDLSVNKITDIGKFLKRVVGTWAHTLRSLRLNNNLLQCLPADVGMLRNLEVLELQYNQLTKLPDDIGRLLKLYQLSLAGNNLDIDDSILSGRAQELRGYFYSRLKRSKERNNVQLTILSDDSCDKGRFMDSLVTGCDFALKTSVEEISSAYLWVLRSAKRSFQVTVWDCDIGPDSIFKAHPQLLLCEQALYVLLVDPDTDSEDTLRNRLLAIAAYAPHCPTVIIELSKTSADAGKVSEPRGSLNSSLKTFGFGPNICHCLHFDAKDVTQGNVAAFSNLVVKILEEHEIKGSVVFGGRIPENYILLEEILKKSREEMSDFPVISYSGLIDLIHNHKETKLDLEDGEDLMTAVRFLTKAGVLYHQADPRSSVRNNFILEPLWLLGQIEKVTAALRKNMALYDVSKPPYLVPAFLMNVTLNSFANAEVSSGVSGIPSKFVPVLLRLMQNRGVIVLVEEDTFFVPSFLEPFPASVRAQTDNAELSADLNRAFLWRILYMDFVPVDFWHQLIARLLGFIKTIFTSFPVYGEDAPDNVKIVCWKKGVTAVYKGSILFSVGSLEDTRTFKSSENIQFGIEVKVMKEPYGHILLPALMDHIEDLAEEFYPSLLEYDMRGQQHISQHVPCPICLKRRESSEIPLSEIHNSSDVHIFPLSELSQFLESSGMEEKKTVSKVLPDIFCANHPDTPLDLADCIPDVLMKDYDPAFEAKSLFLLFDVRSASILGEGGFGTVFRGVYAGDEVAIKSLRAGSSTPAYRNLRTELNVLARLSHPSLIRLHGFMVTSDCYPSPLIIMELAPEGSLSTFLSSLEKLSCDEAMEKFPRFMRQRVAVESLEGLWYLHQNRIIFRDMKPDNVLIISMDRSGPITVKLTDFGISVQSTPAGTIGASGSPGYSAPEVVALKINEKQPNGSKIPYTGKCDIFSYGLMLHEIAVCKTPWFLHPGNTSAATAPPNIPDEAILKGILPAAISTFDDSLRWPHMQVTVSGCLKRNPDDRPSADKLLGMMKTPEFCCFRKTFELGKIKTCVALHARQSTISDVEEGGDGGLNLPPILEIWTISSARLIQARSPSRTQHAEDFSKSCDTDTLSDQSDFTLNPSDRTQVPPMHDKNMIERQSDALKVSPRPHKGARLQKWAWNSANFANKPKFAQKTGVRNLSNLRKVVVDMKSAQIKEQSSCTIEDDIGEITCIVHVPISSQSGFLDASLKSAGFSSAMNFWASLEGKNIKTSPANQTSTNQDVIVVGTNKGTLAKLDISSSMPCTVLMDMRVEITCLYMYTNPTCDETSEAERGKPSADDFVLVGLSDGCIAFISASKVLKGNVRRPDHVVCLVESGRLQSVEKITSSNDRIFAACGRQVSCILFRNGAGRPRVSATKILPGIAAVDGNSCISHIAACHDCIFATMQNSSELFVWSMGSQVTYLKADLRTLAKGKIREPASPGVDTAVATSLLADSARCVLYVGLSSGHVMVLRGVCQQQSQAETSFDVVTVVRRHESMVWDLFLAQDVTTGMDLMFACGVGSQSVSSDFVRPRVSRSDLIGGHSSGLEDGDSNSHIAVYDAHMPSISDEMKEIEKLRAREILKYKKHC